MTSLRDRIGYFGRTAAGFRDYLAAAPLPDPVDRIRERLAARERNFLEIARHAVFDAVGNPYREMFRLAGCEYGDLETAVLRDGIEATLRTLHAQGVYLRHDEFKGKAPIVRSGVQIPSHAASFRNPLSHGGVEGTSAGSRSAGTRIRTSTQARLERQGYYQAVADEFGLSRRRHVLVKPLLPAVDGLFNMAAYARAGCALDRWFSPVARSMDSAHYRAATYLLVAMARAYGVAIPLPEDLPRNDFSPVARWLAKRRRGRIDMVVMAYASPAARVAAAAAELGLEIEGTLFLVGGETLSDGKRASIEACGARVYPRYSISEFGAVGHACRQMNSGDSVHLYSDSMAAIAHRRNAPFSDQTVESLLLTSLAPWAPYALINAEMDDCGTLARASCDCVFSRLGLTTAIHDIWSFGKLTGHGVTLVGADLVRILEQALPARFGGGPTDYQLVETHAADQNRLMLRVSRRVQLSSLEEVKSCFLRELRVPSGGEIASRLWRDADALEVVHEDPVASARGKIMTLHLAGSGAHAA